MINLYDGNNVMLRMMNGSMPGLTPRLTFEKAFREGASQVWVWDGRNHNARRRKLYPDYKMNRKPKGEDVFAFIGFMREVLGFSGAMQIECAGWEADDAIATAARWFAGEGTPVTVHTNDLDYAQLLATPGITLNGVKKIDFEPRYIPLYKALRGDPSDNIPGIPGFGDKAWEAIVPDAEAAKIMLERDEHGDHHLAFTKLTFTKRCATWLTEPENFELIKTYHKITQFIDVPRDELDAGIKVGVPNYSAADALFRKFML